MGFKGGKYEALPEPNLVACSCMLIYNSMVLFLYYYISAIESQPQTHCITITRLIQISRQAQNTTGPRGHK